MNEEISKKYICELCNYRSKRKNDYIKHCSSQRHIDNDFFKRHKEQPELIKQYKEKKNIYKYICECGKKYKYRSGLCRHKIKCEYNKEIEIVKKNENTNENIDSLVNMVKDLIQENKVIQGKLVEISNQPKSMIIQQNNNNHFSIKAYLNTECKNAMNLSEYVNQIKVTFDDLLYMKDHGIVKVFENTFVKGLREMDEKKRPIHCSDKKRCNFYIKDEDTWIKDMQNEKIIEALKRITDQQYDILQKWKELNRDWLDNEVKQEQTNRITTRLVDIYGDKYQSKIINLLTYLEILKSE